MKKMKEINNKWSVYLICIYLLSCCAVVQVIAVTCDAIRSGPYIVRRFGDRCKYMCHCINNTQCDDATGFCASGCNGSWFGPGCQYRNPAFGGYCLHIDNTDPPRLCNLAIDNNETTCSKTDTAASNRTQMPWWKVWLPSDEYISELKIITNTDSLYRFLEFKVFIERVNGTQRHDGLFIPDDHILCYKHGKKAPDATEIYIVCDRPAIGNQVRIQLHNLEAQLVLCDVKINGGRNLAFQGNVSMNSLDSTNYPVINTVDGIHAYDGWNSCAGTYWRTGTHWWIDDFGHIVNIHKITLSSVNNDRIRNYQIVVMNETDTSKNIYDKGGNRIPAKTVTFNSTVARKLKIQRHNANADRLVLCDVEVFGDCVSHACGLVCDKVCHCKYTTPDDKLSGECSRGCEGRWTGNGSKCDRECSPNEWGKYCRSMCGYCKNSEPCDFKTGACPNGCQQGFKETDDCTDECDEGTYGDSCQLNCTQNCVNRSVCSKTDGHCPGGCREGYMGKICDEECSNGTYGYNCSNKCGHCQNNFQCNKTTGDCENGCALGWIGSRCDTECDQGTYGDNCQLNCTHNCVNGSVCSKTDGHCPGGCKEGYMGKRCDEECFNGMYGYNCSKECGHCRNNFPCNKTTGVCENGCASGWIGNTCDAECFNGMYGYNCSKECGHCRNNFPCNKTTGVCENGCASGWIGNTCDAECRQGTYGDNCQLNCTQNCVNDSVCNNTDGHCPGGCRDGYMGQRCDAECDKGLFGKDCNSTCSHYCMGVCHHVDGFCEEGCVDGWMGSDCTQSQIGEELDNSSSVGITSAVVVLIVFVVVVIGLIYWKRNYIVQRCSKYSSSEKTDLTIKFTNKTFDDESLNVDDEDDKVKSGVATEDTNNCYANEGDDDHSRVILKKTMKGQDASDYINASYVKGYIKNRAYIAAQGPIKETVEDFWRMAWENGIRMIIMLTNITESGKSKCLQYWGVLGETQQYGKKNVTLTLEEVFAEFTVRHLEVNNQNNIKTKRNVVQYHYTSWPDKGVPKGLFGLLHFWRKVRQNDENKDHTWLVHCSAGVGRTGTFIATDILYERGLQTGYINVHECVTDLRVQRANMVQTKKQYVLLYRLMAELFCLPFQPVKVDDFASHFMAMSENDGETGQTKLFHEYEHVQREITAGNVAALKATSTRTSVKESSDDLNQKNIDRFATAKLPENTDKNRLSSILASDEHRSILSTFVAGCTNYINAVVIPSYEDLHGYIITQLPLANTTIDWYRLILERGIQLIVTFPDERESMMAPSYLPGARSLQNGPFIIRFESEVDQSNFVLKTYTLQYQDKKQAFNQLVYKHWPADDVIPSDENSMLRLIAEIHRQNCRSEKRPILLQCWDGAERSGLLLTLMNIIEYVKFDKEVAIPQIVRHLKTRREQIISSFDKYKFCREVICRHLESSTATYANI